MNDTPKTPPTPHCFRKPAEILHFNQIVGGYYSKSLSDYVDPDGDRTKRIDEFPPRRGGRDKGD